MPDESLDLDPLDDLAEQFVDRLRRGEWPALTEYTNRHPELADQIRELFPLLITMEQVRPAGPRLGVTRHDCWPRLKERTSRFAIEIS